MDLRQRQDGSGAEYPRYGASARTPCPGSSAHLIRLVKFLSLLVSLTMTFGAPASLRLAPPGATPVQAAQQQGAGAEEEEEHKAHRQTRKKQSRRLALASLPRLRGVAARKPRPSLTLRDPIGWSLPVRHLVPRRLPPADDSQA